MSSAIMGLHWNRKNATQRKFEMHISTVRQGVTTYVEFFSQVSEYFWRHTLADANDSVAIEFNLPHTATTPGLV